MAEIIGSGAFQDDGSFSFSWEALANGDTGKPVRATFRAMSFHVVGTFGTGGSVSIEVSNDGVNWVAQGTAITAAGTKVLTEPFLAARPNVTAGDVTTDLDVFFVAIPA